MSPSLLPFSLDNVQDDGHGLGVWGSLVVALLIAASVGLFFAMRRSLGRVTFKEEQSEDVRPGAGRGTDRDRDEL